MDTSFLILLWGLRIFVILFTILAWRNLKWAIFLICASLPSYLIRFKYPFDIPGTALELMILIVFAVWLIKIISVGSIVFAPAKLWSRVASLREITRRVTSWLHSPSGLWSQQKIPKKILFGTLLFLVFATFSIFISPDLRGALGIWKAYFIEPLLFIIVFISIIKKEDIKWVIFSLSFSAFYISLFAIAQMFYIFPVPMPWQEELRATSIFPFPNAVGLFLAPIIPLLFSSLRRRNEALPRSRKRGNLALNIFFVITIILSVIAIVLAQTEAALVALFAGLLFYLLIKNKTTRKILLGLILIILTSTILISNTAFFETVKSKILLEDWSGMVRKTIWLETFEMLKDKPLGVGLNGYQTAIVPYHTSRVWMEIFLYPHNIFLNFWSEIGLLGLLSFIIIVSHFYIISRKNPALMTAMTVLLVHGLVDVPYFKNDLSILFWILIGFSLILYRND